MITPDNNTRISTVAINLPQQYFKLTAIRNILQLLISFQRIVRVLVWMIKNHLLRMRLKIQSNQG
jgi:hypothetical protein